jgi:hypothetical protein
MVLSFVPLFVCCTKPSKRLRMKLVLSCVLLSMPLSAILQSEAITPVPELPWLHNSATKGEGATARLVESDQTPRPHAAHLSSTSCLLLPLKPLPLTIPDHRLLPHRTLSSNTTHASGADPLDEAPGILDRHTTTTLRDTPDAGLHLALAEQPSSIAGAQPQFFVRRYHRVVLSLEL